MTPNVKRNASSREFPEHTYEQWHAAAEALLKGAPFEKRLVSRTYEDITIQPIYRREDIANLEHRKHFPGSGIRSSAAATPAGFLEHRLGSLPGTQGPLPRHPQRASSMKASTAAKANSTSSSAAARPNAAPAASPSPPPTDRQNRARRRRARRRLDLSGTAAHPPCPSPPSSSPPPNNSAFPPPNSAAASKTIRSPNSSRKGALRQSLAMRFDHMAALTDYAAKNAPQLRTITVKGDVYHNAGATATQELAYVISTLVCYIEEMKSRGLAPETVLPHVRIRLAVGSDYFMEIAKIRAARWLWSKVAAAYGVENAPVHIHASTSRWNKTTYDAHTNMLRVTAEAFAAVVAGVDSLHIGPYDEIAGHTDEFSRRIARNLHTILREECGLDRVIDPAGGSTYIEWLTDQIAAKSWEIFQDIEKQGGMIAASKTAPSNKPSHAVREREVQEHPHPQGQDRRHQHVSRSQGQKTRHPRARVQGRPADPRRPAAATRWTHRVRRCLDDRASHRRREARRVQALASPLAIGLSNNEGAPTVTALPPHRAAEEYEALRDASAAFAAKTGAAPAILQLNIGPVPQIPPPRRLDRRVLRSRRFRRRWRARFPHPRRCPRRPRRQQGRPSPSSPRTTTPIWKPSPRSPPPSKPPNRTSPCSSPAAPGDNEAAWRAAGVDDFVNVRSNNYELNEQLLQKAGVL